MLFLLFCSNVFCSSNPAAAASFQSVDKSSISSGSSTPSERFLPSSTGSSPNVSPQRLPSPNGSPGLSSSNCPPPLVAEWEGRKIDWSLQNDSLEKLEKLRELVIKVGSSLDEALIKEICKLRQQLGVK